jgi:hypothetical protein
LTIPEPVGGPIVIGQGRELPHDDAQSAYGTVGALDETALLDEQGLVEDVVVELVSLWVPGR